MKKQVQFHWQLVNGGEYSPMSRTELNESRVAALPDPEKQIEFCQAAERLGMESLLVAIGYAKPDPLLLSSCIAPFSKKIKFLIAVRSGLISPVFFTQQINTFSAAYNGRVLLNIVAGYSPIELGYYGDFLPHADRYERTAEFLKICNAIWRGKTPFDFNGKYYKIRQAQIYTPFISPDRQAPYIFLAGGSEDARKVAIQEADCWMRFPDTIEKLATDIRPVLDAEKEVGLRMSVVIRPTKKEAIEAAYSLNRSVQNRKTVQNAEKKIVQDSDSVSYKKNYHSFEGGWLNEWIWTGAVKTMGTAAIAFVGTPSEFRDMVMAYKKIGITQYILSGWPKLDSMQYFGKNVLPIVRERENKN